MSLQNGKWRLIRSGACDAYANMAADEALLESFIQRGGGRCLRVYSWSPEAFTLGRYEDAAPFKEITRRNRSIDFTRRLTGGGLIFHSGDISYSVTCPYADLEISSVRESVELISSFLIKAYGYLGIKAAFSGPGTKRNRREPWFCSGHKERHDIAVCGKKIGGNAQKHKKRFLLQHGSIPLGARAWPAGSVGTSLEEILGYAPSREAVENHLIRAFRETFRIDFEKTGLTREEQALARRLAEEKYKNEEWIYGGKTVKETIVA
jgi:lipoyl(octanoyl) transferase